MEFKSLIFKSISEKSNIRTIILYFITFCRNQRAQIFFDSGSTPPIKFFVSIFDFFFFGREEVLWSDHHPGSLERVIPAAPTEPNDAWIEKVD